MPAKADIKAAIEQKGVTVGDGTIDTYSEKIGEISSGGGDSYYDTFWDSFQENGNRTNYSQAFSGFNDETFTPLRGGSTNVCPTTLPSPTQT